MTGFSAAANSPSAKAIAGKDISEDFSGLDWKKQY